MLIYFYSIFVIILIFILAYWYGRKTRQWKWSEYFLMAVGPVIGAILLSWTEGFQIITYFIACGFIGLLGEFVLGLFCHKILGRRLWSYRKCSLLGYTSLLTFPFWGGGGIVFLTLAKLLNLI